MAASLLSGKPLRPTPPCALNNRNLAADRKGVRGEWFHLRPDKAELNKLFNPTWGDEAGPNPEKLPDVLGIALLPTLAGSGAPGKKKPASRIEASPAVVAHVVSSRRLGAVSTASNPE